MATRSVTDGKRDNLKAMLRARCRDGVFESGRPIPSVRELAEEFGLSKVVTGEVVRDMVAEGLLYSVPRVGTFVGAPRMSNQTSLLLLGPDSTSNSLHRHMRIGFEDFVASCGSNVLALEYSTALAHHAANDLPPFCGVFDLSYLPHGERSWVQSMGDLSIPHVRFHTHESSELSYDMVCFDDVGGGRQATQHLINLGHTRIAFLALHSRRHDSGRVEWSQQREIGWRETLLKSNLSPEGMAFHPQHDPTEMSAEEEMRVGREAAQSLVENLHMSAVVAANDNAAQVLLEALAQTRTPRERWPAIVGFDGEAGLGENLVSSLRLPWEEIGRAAGGLLHQRSLGALPPSPVTRKVPMKLIPRLTCRKNWGHQTGQVVLSPSP